MSDILTNNNEDYTNVQYKVVRNGAASKNAGKDVFSARVVTKETYSTKQLADRMVSEGCLAKASTIRLVLTDFAELIGKLVAEGRAVNIGGLVRFRPGIRGTFDTADASWNTGKNAIVVNASVGSRMRAAAALSGVTRVDAVDAPTLTLLIEAATNQPNVIPSGANFYVTGSNLLWDAEAEDEGWFMTYNGVESKCIAVNATQNPEYATLMTNQEFTEAGEPLTLVFRTRLGGEMLHSVTYDQDLVTGANA